jgi:hypothetical protein
MLPDVANWLKSIHLPPFSVLFSFDCSCSIERGSPGEGCRLGHLVIVKLLELSARIGKIFLLSLVKINMGFVYYHGL